MKEIVDQLSKREKRLLYILACFLIIIAGWFFLIIPSLDKQTLLNQQYETVLMDNYAKQSELDKYLAAPDELKIKQESLKEIIEKYNPVMTNENIDKLLTSAFLSNGLKPISLNISEVKPASSSSDESVETSYVTQATISVSVSGTLVQITNTVNSLHEMKGVEVSTFTYTEGTTIGETTNASLTIIVYMAQQ